MSVMPDTEYTVGAAADVTGVSVRALHHYDEIGLLRPSRRNPAGYRIYSPDDLQRLQSIAFYRELGFDLADIAEILGDPDTTDEDHLRRQRELIDEQAGRLQAMLKLIDEELSARASGIALTPEQRREVFGDRRFTDHGEQARRQWGQTEPFAQRQQRTARYTKADWLQLRTELHAIHQGLADALLSGVPPTDPVAMDLAERHREHTDKWFHDCSHDTHVELAEHYRANRRRGRNYDDMVPGLSQYVHDAIHANHKRFATGRRPLADETGR